MEDIDVGMPDGSLTLNRQDGEDENEDEDEDDASESSDKRKNKKNKGAARGGGVTLSGLLNAIVCLLRKAPARQATNKMICVYIGWSSRLRG